MGLDNQSRIEREIDQVLVSADEVNRVSNLGSYTATNARLTLNPPEVSLTFYAKKRRKDVFVAVVRSITEASVMVSRHGYLQLVWDRGTFSDRWTFDRLKADSPAGRELGDAFVDARNAG